MKNVLRTLLLAFVVGLVSCVEDPNSPKAIVKKSFECVEKEDYRGYVDLLYKTAEISDEEKEKYVKFIEEMSKLAKEDGQSANISRKILSEEIDEEAGTAKVKVRVTQPNGEEHEVFMDLKKDKNGNWKLSN